MTSRRDFLWLAAACGFTASAHAAGARHTVAQSKAGKIGGVREHGVYVFRGVPYGMDTAARRFLPPSAPAGWQRVRDAHE
jgi:para-nitrobenzyl esterase